MTDSFHPLVRDWFAARFAKPTEPQVQAWPLIRAGQDVLVSAPTGSGKTLAAFLICLDDLIQRAADGRLNDETLVVYVSPLKALTNDVRKNLELPLAELLARAVEARIPLDTIRTAVRTGDTTQSQRQQMLRKPPHVLVTTPESLFILLTAEKSRALFTNVHTVVVDEIHAMANSKRGSHLALTLARLDDLVVAGGNKKPQRIGLSATIRPLDHVAAFLSPNAKIIDVGSRREMGLEVKIPSEELGAVASNEMWGEIYETLAGLIRANRTTLVFVPTRRMSERVAFNLTERLGEGQVMPHHGSLAKEARFEAENRLKNGELKAVVATASLELGIDIGSIDLVVQLGSPRSIATGLQRIGRSGHWVGAKPQGKIFATTRDELLECAALVRSMRGGAIDALVIPTAPLDILAQQIVASTATRDWHAQELFDLVRQAYPYKDLSREDFDEVISMLADGIATARGRSGTYLHYDRVNDILRARRGARMAAITCGGAIPDVANYKVVAEPDGHLVGTLDEDFAIESMAGDIFLLGTTSWKIRRVEAGTVRVEDAHGAPPSIPFWNGEGLGRTIELSQEVSALRTDIDQRSDEAAVEMLQTDCGLDRPGAEQTVAYIRSAKAVLGVIPTIDTIVAERFFDEGGGMQLILHTPFGARINRAWGLALRKRFCVTFNFELQSAATDNGIVISLAEQHAFPLEAVFEYVKSQSVVEVLTQALLPAPMFEARWRWNSMRSLAILRMRGGRKVAPQLLRMRADDLLASVFPDQVACAENLSGPIRIPDHVLVRETIDNCLHEAMDIDGLLAVLRGVESGTIKTVAVDTPEPSTFSHEILNANPYAFLDDAPLEERRTRAVQLRRGTRVDFDGSGIVDPAAIAEVAQESWPVVRDAEELHDALATLIVVPPLEAWRPWFEELVAQNRATAVVVSAVEKETARLRAPDAAAAESAVQGELSNSVVVSGASAGVMVSSGVILSGAPAGRAVEGQAAEGIAGDVAAASPSTAPPSTSSGGSAQDDISRTAVSLWTCAERLELARTVYTNATLQPEIAAVPGMPMPEFPDDGVTEIVRGWLECSGPVTVTELAETLAVSEEHVAAAMLRLETQGQVLRGHYRGRDQEEWCNRRVLARIHRLTIGRLRREIEPVTTGDYARFLYRWQHVSPASRLHGIDGTLQVIRQLAGYEIPAAAWEMQILPKRVAGYKPEYLDRLCYSGEVMWGRLSPHPALLPSEEERKRFVRPTKLAPISLFPRAEAHELILRAPAEPEGLSHAAKDVLAEIERRGAPFFVELVRGAKRLPAEVEEGLWQLVAAGLITADGFDALRSLIDAKRRLGDAGRRARPRSSGGRWTRLVAETDKLDPESFARRLLARWGVVFRDIVARESIAPRWRDVLMALRRLEARGEIRGGRFIVAIVGDQFALPDAIDALRAVRREGGDEPLVEISGYDPLSIVNTYLPEPRVRELTALA